MLSNLSNIPPCPGIIFPLSLTFDSLLNFDSIKSPRVPNMLIIIAIISQFDVSKLSLIYLETSDAEIQQKNSPPRKPSIVLCGDTL